MTHIADYHRFPGHRARHGESHCHAVIAAAFHPATADLATLYADPIRRQPHPDTQAIEALGHGLETIAFLEAQLGGAGYRSLTAGEGCGHEDER